MDVLKRGDEGEVVELAPHDCQGLALFVLDVAQALKTGHHLLAVDELQGIQLMANSIAYLFEQGVLETGVHD